MNNLKILFVLDNYFPYLGGAETLFRKLAEELAIKGNQVTVICPRTIRDCPGREVLNGVQIHRLNLKNRYLFTFLALPAILRAARRADVIHTTTYNAAPTARLAAILTRKKAIITVHEILGKIWWKKLNPISAFLHWSFEKMILKLNFDHFVAVSHFTENCLKKNKVPAAKLSVVYHGIDYELFDLDKADGSGVREKLKLKKEFVYLYFGRPGISKGLEYLIRAVPRIKAKIAEAKLVMVLAKEPQNRYKFITGLIEELAISQDLILLDPVPAKQLVNYIAAADCVVVPSLSEGFGFCAAESCALNKPVVISETGALPEVVSGRVIRIKPADIHSLEKGVISAYQKKWQNIPAKKFSWDVAIAKYLEIYSEL